MNRDDLVKLIEGCRLWFASMDGHYLDHDCDVCRMNRVAMTLGVEALERIDGIVQDVSRQEDSIEKKRELFRNMVVASIVGGVCARVPMNYLNDENAINRAFEVASRAAFVAYPDPS